MGARAIVSRARRYSHVGNSLTFGMQDYLVVVVGAMEGKRCDTVQSPVVVVLALSSMPVSGAHTPLCSFVESLAFADKLGKAIVLEVGIPPRSLRSAE